MVFPGAPRKPRSCALGCAGSPMSAKFWLPYGSIWLAPIITCRRPDQTTSNMARYGFQDSTTLGASSSPTGSTLPTRSASPSVTTRSGSKVARARRPPIIGTFPIGLARISRSPRNTSATATTQTSARVASVTAVSQPDCLEVLVVAVDVEVAVAERVPGGVVTRGRRVLALEGLVAVVVGRARREVGAERGLDHAVDHQTVDAHCLHGSLRGEILGRDDLLDRHEPPRRRQAEQIVEVRVDAEVLAVPAGVAAVHVDERDVELERRHGDELLALVIPPAVRRLHGAQLRIEAEHVGGETGPSRQERHAPCRRLQPQEKHPLVELTGLHGARLAGGAEVRLQWDRVERHEREHRPLHLAEAAQQPNVGTAVAHEREVLDRRAGDGSDERHGLA